MAPARHQVYERFVAVGLVNAFCLGASRHPHDHLVSPELTFELIDFSDRAGLRKKRSNDRAEVMLR